MSSTSSTSNNDPPTQTLDSLTAADYLNPSDTTTPAEETGLNASFHNTYDPAMKREAPRMPEMQTKSAREKLDATSSGMSTKALQQAAVEGDPNNLLGMGKEKARQV
ncbi:hypothetical protein Tdes44962_MAKER07539 [Teratosphaeria destructans]|uniref:Uncharacterized protein n=1 Tax=Teratosphaeria destructans TaxID=418781 RepID=A0A9W7SZD8_9PEZI|nr:hypothetical protein Tdes44962_MAKER07539 [Teratosphaeria destructans]